MSRKTLISALIAAAALAAAPGAMAASGSGTQLVTGTVGSAISVTPTTPVLLGGGVLSPGSASAATGSGTVAVTSTDRYCLTVADASGNNGHLSDGLGHSFTSALQWKDSDANAAAGAGTLASLSSTPANVALTRPNTLLETWTVNYSQALLTENVPAGVYSTTITFSGQTC